MTTVGRSLAKFQRILGGTQELEPLDLQGYLVALVPLRDALQTTWRKALATTTGPGINITLASIAVTEDGWYQIAATAMADDPSPLAAGRRLAFFIGEGAAVPYEEWWTIRDVSIVAQPTIAQSGQAVWLPNGAIVGWVTRSAWGAAEIVRTSVMLGQLYQTTLS